MVRVSYPGSGVTNLFFPAFLKGIALTPVRTVKGVRFRADTMVVVSRSVGLTSCASEDGGWIDIASDYVSFDSRRILRWSGGIVSDG